jgi:hypothetical protein
MTRSRLREGAHLRADGWNHACLEREGVIIDITAAQFEGATEPVACLPTSTWHGIRVRLVSSSRPPNMSFFADGTT